MTNCFVNVAAHVLVASIIILIIIFVCFMMQEMEPYVTIVGFGSGLRSQTLE